MDDGGLVPHPVGLPKAIRNTGSVEGIYRLASHSMSIALLKTLLTVSEAGTFAAAADRLGVTQAAVGQQMRRLEEQSGQTLFDRSSGKPVLLAEGRDLVARARDLVAEYDGLMTSEPAGQALSGELKLGAVPSTLTELVPVAIKRLVEAHPDLQVRIVSGLSVDLLDQVERGALDAAITSRPAASATHLRWQHLAREPLVLITSHPIKDQTPKDILSTQPYIRHTRRADAGLLADAWLKRNKVTVRTAMELETLEAVARMVAHGLGVALVPDICVPGATFDGLTRVSLGSDPPGRDLGVLSREPNRLTDELVAQMLGVIG